MSDNLKEADAVHKLNTSVFNRSLASPAFLCSFAAGGIAGAVSRTIVSPLERMKILFQVQHCKNYNGIYSSLSKIYREEGFKGYMRGNGVNCLRIVPYSAIQFASYHALKHMFLPPGQTELQTWQRLSSGALAGMISVAATYPLDITRTRLSVHSAQITLEHRANAIKLPGMFETARSIYLREGGIKALYRGIWPTMIGVAPYVGLNFAVYEGLRASLVQYQHHQPNAAEKLLCGAISGAVAQTITYPADVLRRRFQVREMTGVQFKYESVTHAFRTIVAKEGFRGLYNGILPNLLKVVPSMSMSWLTYEFTRDMLRKSFNVLD